MLPLFSNKGERAPSKRPWAVAILVFAFVSWVVLTIYGFKAPWSPHFGAKPLPQSVVGASSGPVFEGARIFHNKGCLYCHDISGHGGHRGPDLSRIGDLLTRDQLMDKAMGTDVFVTDRAIDVHITAIRKKLADANWLIHTVRGVGYRLQEAPGEAE